MITAPLGEPFQVTNRSVVALHDPRAGQGPHGVGLEVLLGALPLGAHHGALPRVHVHQVQGLAQRVSHQETSVAELAHRLDGAEILGEGGVRACEGRLGSGVGRRYGEGRGGEEEGGAGAHERGVDEGGNVSF